jgi:hypothetical protein
MLGTRLQVWGRHHWMACLGGAKQYTSKNMFAVGVGLERRCGQLGVCGGLCIIKLGNDLRREMNKILKHLEHRWLPIDKDTCNNQAKRGIDA